MLNCLKGHRKVKHKKRSACRKISTCLTSGAFSYAISLFEVELVAGLLLEDLKNGL